MSNNHYREIFSKIYDTYGFGSEESRSGIGSTLEQTEHTRTEIKAIVKNLNIKSVVDIPCGDFNWMKDIVYRFESYVGGDIVPQCIETNQRKYGNETIKFINFDLLTDPIPEADLLIVRDVIGHFPIDDAYKIAKNIVSSKCKYLLSTTWYNTNGKEYYKQHINKGAEAHGRFFPVCLMAKPFNFPEPIDYIIEDVMVDDYDKGNRKVLALWDIETIRDHLKNMPEPKPKPKARNKELTIVSGLWNIGRPGRDFSHYLEHFDKFLQIEHYMYLHIPKELEAFVWERRSAENTCVRTFELSDIKQLYSPFWDKTQEIRLNPAWNEQTGKDGWLKGSPQAALEWYNPIVQSKMFMLHDAKILNPFDTPYLIWLDAGITNTVYEKYFNENHCFDSIIPHLNTFLFLSYPYETTTEIHGFDKKAIDRYARADVKYVCRGGLFGGHRDAISSANSTYYSILQQTLNDGFMGTEESVFSIMAHLEPHIYRRFELDGNGLIVKFVQSLLDNKVTLAPVTTHKVDWLPKGFYSASQKTHLYMLTFNFPQQIRHTLQTWQNNSPSWLTKPKLFLLDNSTDLKAIELNKEIAAEFKFEYIHLGKNTGICGGRQFAAEHFDKSDADYYFFFEDDMGLWELPTDGVAWTCRNGFRLFVPYLYEKVHEIMAREQFDFLKLSYTEVYMDNNIQVSWYNVPQAVRSSIWPEYDKLPVSGLDPNAPRTRFDRIGVHKEISYISGDIYYANWPMIMNKAGNRKVFLDTKWSNPFEQTWMSHCFQETVKGNIKPACLLASPIHHNRIAYYKPEERREN